VNQLLANPAFQSGLVPFVVALAAALLLRPLGRALTGISFSVAYYVSAYLVTGLQFMPLTSTRKMLLAGLAAAVLGLVLDWLSPRKRFVPFLLAALGAAAVLWMIWPVIVRKEGAELWSLTAASLVYAGWLIGASHGLRGRPDGAAVAALVLGLGTGISALLGASALLGQLGIAIGVAAGAYVLVDLSRWPVPTGSGFILPAVTLGAMVGIAAVVYARLPWYSLLPLAAVPLLMRVPLPANFSRRRRVLALCAMAAPAAGLAIFLTWRVTGMPPL